MKSHMKPLVIIAAISFVAACSSKKDVADPKDPSDENPTLTNDPVPERSLENQAGLIITSSPEGVEIRVDGKSAGTTPLEVEGLASGEHEVTFMFEGDAKTTLTVELGVGEFRKMHQSVAPDASDALLGGK